MNGFSFCVDFSKYIYSIRLRNEMNSLSTIVSIMASANVCRFKTKVHFFGVVVGKKGKKGISIGRVFFF